MAFEKPSVPSIRAALGKHSPELADQPIELLGEGWSLWAFRVGDHVVRFPKRLDDARQFETERRLLPELVRHVSIPIPVPDLYGEDGPNGAPFAGSPFLPGVSVLSALQLVAASARSGRSVFTPAPSFGHDLGVFLRELHSFPVERALALGVELRDGAGRRAWIGDLYERTIRRAFPLISCEARTYANLRFEAYLNDGANFEFEPRLIHHDLDRQNTLIDPDTGKLAGVIDFGDVVVSNPLIDFWMPLLDFEALGIASQLPALLDAYGADKVDLTRAWIEVEFVHYLWPFHDILYGLDMGDDGLVEEGIRSLNSSLPRDLSCT